MLDSGLSGMGEQTREAGLLARKGAGGQGARWQASRAKPGWPLAEGPWPASAPLFPQLLLGEVHENRSKRLVGTKRTRRQTAT